MLLSTSLLSLLLLVASLSACYLPVALGAPGSGSTPQATLLTSARQGTSCQGSVRYESCSKTKCCPLPKRCCSKGCCDSNVKCTSTPSARNVLLSAFERTGTAAMTIRQSNTCQGNTKYESCSATTCCPSPKCCCTSGTGCCKRDGGKCFPGTASVTLRSGAKRFMGDLQIGDEVAVGAGKYSRVFAFSHRDASTASDYVQLSTKAGVAVTATHGHLLPVITREGESRKMMAAGEVRVGDKLPVVKEGEEVTSAVVDVETVSGHGLFNPHTVHGDIVVDGVVCSTYTTHVPMVAAHGLLTPVRAVFKAAAMLILPSSA